MSLITSAISALDTPSSLLPFFVKDSFDVTGRTVMANNEGGKHEAREKFIEEAGTSLFWIGGIPLIRAIGNKFVQNKIDTNIDFKRINSDGVQGYFADELNGKGNSKKFSASDLKGIVHKGGKLDEIKEKLTKTGGPKGKYRTYHIGITAASVLINLVILMVALPKFNQYLSRVIISKETENKEKQQKAVQFGNTKAESFEEFKNKSKNKDKKVSFGALSDLVKFKNIFNFEMMAEDAQLNVQSSMLILDYGISGSRVTIVPRNNNERIENFIKEGGIIFFFYYAADILKKALAKFADKAFKMPIDLDYRTIVSKEFLNALKRPHKKDEFLNFAKLEENDSNAELKVIRFIDEELAKKDKDCPENKVFDNFTLKTAQEDKLIKVVYDEKLKRWVRDPKKYIKTDKVVELNSFLSNFYNKVMEKIQKGESLESVMSKTKKAKIMSVVANIAICCASLSFILPKIQYMVRECRTKTSRAPGIKLYQDLAENHELVV